LTFAAGASLRYRTARALLMASQIPGVGSRSGFGNVYDRLGELVGVPRAFGMGFIIHLAGFLIHAAQLRSKASLLFWKQSSALTGWPGCNCSHAARSLASSHLEQPAKANETSANTKTFLIGRICAPTQPFSSLNDFMSKRSA
jgi:hypothetical protein